MSDDLFLLQSARRLLTWRAVECTVRSSPSSDCKLFLGQRQWHKLYKDIKAFFFPPIGFMHFDKREIGTWE